MSNAVNSDQLDKSETPMNESARFDAIVRKVFSVSHDEIVKREKEYQHKRNRAKQKRLATKRKGSEGQL